MGVDSTASLLYHCDTTVMLRWWCAATPLLLCPTPPPCTERRADVVVAPHVVTCTLCSPPPSPPIYVHMYIITTAHTRARTRPCSRQKIRAGVKKVVDLLPKERRDDRQQVGASLFFWLFFCSSVPAISTLRARVSRGQATCRSRPPDAACTATVATIAHTPRSHTPTAAVRPGQPPAGQGHRRDGGAHSGPGIHPCRCKGTPIAVDITSNPAALPRPHHLHH